MEKPTFMLVRDTLQSNDPPGKRTATGSESFLLSQSHAATPTSCCSTRKRVNVRSGGNEAYLQNRFHGVRLHIRALGEFPRADSNRYRWMQSISSPRIRRMSRSLRNTRMEYFGLDDQVRLAALLALHRGPVFVVSTRRPSECSTLS